MRIDKAVRNEWAGLLRKTVPSTLIQDGELTTPSEYGFIHVLYKEEGRAEDYELVVGGYASPQVIDREKHLITKEAMAADLPRFLAHPKYRNAMIVHSNIQVGEVLPKWCHPKTGECFETKVDDIGLFCLVKIRTDKYRPEICEKVEKDVLAGKLASFSISGDAPFDARRHTCHNGTCFWIIDKIVFYEITVCELGVNQDAKFSILSKMAYCADGSCAIELPGRLTSGVITKTLDSHVHKQTGSPTMPSQPKEERPTRQDPTHADVGQRAGSAMGSGSLPRGPMEEINKHPGHSDQSVHGSPAEGESEDGGGERMSGPMAEFAQGARFNPEVLREAFKKGALKQLSWQPVHSLSSAFVTKINGEDVLLQFRANTSYQVHGRIRDPSGTRTEYSVELTRMHRGGEALGMNSVTLMHAAVRGESYERKDALKERVDRATKRLLSVEPPKYYSSGGSYQQWERLHRELAGETEKAEDTFEADVADEMEEHPWAGRDVAEHIVEDHQKLGKARRYIGSPQDAPEGAKPQRGKRGGWYYETEGARGPAQAEEESERRPLPGTLTGKAERYWDAYINGDVGPSRMPGDVLRELHNYARRRAEAEPSPSRVGNWDTWAEDFADEIEGQTGKRPRAWQDSFEWEDQGPNSDYMEAKGLAPVKGVEGGAVRLLVEKKPHPRRYWGFQGSTPGFGTGRPGSWAIGQSNLRSGDEVVRAAPYIQEAVNRHRDPERNNPRVKVAKVPGGYRISEYDFGKWEELLPAKIGKQLGPGGGTGGGGEAGDIATPWSSEVHDPFDTKRGHTEIVEPAQKCVHGVSKGDQTFGPPDMEYGEPEEEQPKAPPKEQPESEETEGEDESGGAEEEKAIERKHKDSRGSTAHHHGSATGESQRQYAGPRGRGPTPKQRAGMAIAALKDPERWQDIMGPDEARESLEGAVGDFRRQIRELNDRGYEYDHPKIQGIRDRIHEAEDALEESQSWERAHPEDDDAGFREWEQAHPTEEKHNTPNSPHKEHDPRMRRFSQEGEHAAPDRQHVVAATRISDPGERAEEYGNLARHFQHQRGSWQLSVALHNAGAAARAGNRRVELHYARQVASSLYPRRSQEQKHMTPQPHGHVGGTGQPMPAIGKPQLPQSQTLRRPRPFKPAGPMFKDEDFKVKIKGDPEDVKEFLSKVWSRDQMAPYTERPYGGLTAGRDDVAGGEESEEYYLNKGCPLCAARGVIELALDNRELYSAMSPEFMGILRHSLAALQQGIGELDYAEGPGWVALASDHSVTGFTKAGYAIPLIEVMQAIGASAFERGQVSIVRAAMDAGTGLLNLMPLDEVSFSEQLSKALDKARGIVILKHKGPSIKPHKHGEAHRESDPDFIRQFEEIMGPRNPKWTPDWEPKFKKGYNVGWLGQAQRLLAQLTNKLSKVKKEGMPDHILLALASLADDLGHLENALGVTEELKGAIKGVEEPELNVVREVAKNTEGDVERADDALAAIDPELEKERSTERYERDNPVQTLRPAEVDVMTGAPAGVPTDNPDKVTRDASKDPAISKAVHNMRVTKQTGPDSDLWGAQNRGSGRRALGPVTEEFDTPDQGQHPAYELNRPLRSGNEIEPPTKPQGGHPDYEYSRPLSEAVDIDVAANRGVATTGDDRDPDALVDYSSGPHEPRWPDDPNTAGEVHKHKDSHGSTEHHHGQQQRRPSQQEPEPELYARRVARVGKEQADLLRQIGTVGTAGPTGRQRGLLDQLKTVQERDMDALDDHIRPYHAGMAPEDIASELSVPPGVVEMWGRSRGVDFNQYVDKHRDSQGSTEHHHGGGGEPPGDWSSLPPPESPSAREMARQVKENPAIWAKHMSEDQADYVLSLPEPPPPERKPFDPSGLEPGMRRWERSKREAKPGYRPRMQKDKPAQWAQDRAIDPSRIRNGPELDVPMRVHGAGEPSEDGYFEDQGPESAVVSRQPIREREVDNRGAIRDESHNVPIIQPPRPKLRMGNEDAKALFKLHASMWTRYVTDKKLTLAVVRKLENGGLEVIDMAER